MDISFEMFSEINNGSVRVDNITFYNCEGKPVAYTDDEEHIYLFSGEPVAYFKDESVYGFNGKHLGRIGGGWIRDNKGCCVFFADETCGSGPTRPVKQLEPVKSVQSIRPVKSAKQSKPFRPAESLSWSAMSSEKFFYQ